MKRQIFVFGSNLAGRHGKGAAQVARKKHGAVIGVGEGLTGNAYAIPTKSFRIQPRSLDEIKQSVDRFLEFAKLHPELEFNVSAIGCGLAGYSPRHIAPMFAVTPPNVNLPKEFLDYFTSERLARWTTDDE